MVFVTFPNLHNGLYFEAVHIFIINQIGITPWLACCPEAGKGDWSSLYLASK